MIISSERDAKPQNYGIPIYYCVWLSSQLSVLYIFRTDQPFINTQTINLYAENTQPTAGISVAAELHTPEDFNNNIISTR